MKKPIFLAAFLLLFVSANAFAKTEGHYVGLDAIKSKSSYSDSQNLSYNIKDDTKNSFGIKYGHAFNMDGFILAPEVFYDNLDLEMKDSFDDNWQIKRRFGAKINLGYDFTDKFAALANIGIARTVYDVEWNSNNIYKKNYTSDDLIYGVSLKYSILDNMDISLGYDISKIQMEEPDSIVFPGRLLDFDVKTTRLGIAYKF